MPFCFSRFRGLLLSFFVLLLTLPALGQRARPAWAWARTSGTPTAYVEDRQLKVDRSGSSYVLGLANQPDTIGGVAVPAGGFLMKYDSAGTVEWVRTGNGNYQYETGQIALDNAGNCYLMLRISNLPTGTAQFGNLTFSAAGGQIGVVKVTPAGQVLWWQPMLLAGDDLSRAFGLTNSALTVDRRGAVYLASRYQSIAVVDSTLTFGPAEHQSLCVVKYDSARVRQWAFSTEGGAITPVSIAADAAGNCYVSGLFKDTVRCGADTIIARRAPNYESFLLRLTRPGPWPGFARRMPCISTRTHRSRRWPSIRSVAVS